MSERKLSMREQVLRLRDTLNNGIKYDKKRNIYILVWTERQLRIARRQGNKLWKMTQRRVELTDE